MDEHLDGAAAIVGVAAILPDAPDVATFWDNVTSGRYSISDVSSERWDPALYYDPDPRALDKTYSKIGGWVRDFEWNPLGWKLPIPPRVADSMDDGQKWAVNLARAVLLDYGWPDRPLDRENTAVILGNAMAGEKHYLSAMRVGFPEFARDLEGSSTFAQLPSDVRKAIVAEAHERMAARIPGITEDTMPGELANIIAGRVANVFDLRGPNYVTDAACASGIAAMSAAIEGLVRGEYDAAITGGIDRNMGASTFVKFCKIGALSATGTRPYADGADGFVMGEGASVFLVKRLADAERDGDRIYAVVRGISGSSDGRGKGITAPNPVGQRLCVERAWRRTGLSPATATYVEGHGTSTRVGDVVEVEALSEVFGGAGASPGSILLGSVKSNIGHLKGAAGAAGLLKTVLALHHKVVPPSINAAVLNPNIDFSRSPLRVNTELREWEVREGQPRRAGVSAFGFGGTNFHVVLEEYVPGRADASGTDKKQFTVGVQPTTEVAPQPAVAANANAAKAPLRGALVIGAASEAELAQRLTAVIADAEAGHAPDPARPAAADLAARVRIAIDYGDAAELAQKAAKARTALAQQAAPMWRALRAQGVFLGRGAPPKVAFLYTGQGSQYVNMLAELRDSEPLVAGVFADADRVMTPLLGRPLSEFIFVDGSDPAAVAQLEEELKQTEITQPAVLATDLALTRMLAAYGVEPDLVMGHSLGEYGALVAADALDFGHALEAVSARGHEMASLQIDDKGAMAAVIGPMKEIERIVEAVDGYVVVANVNSLTQAVIGGATAAVEEAIRRLEDAEMTAMRIPVSHAFHTSIVAPASEPLRQVLTRLGLRAPRIPLVANVDGEFYPTGDDAPAQMVDILGRQVASPVQFVKGLRTLYDAGARVFVEVGPKKALHGFADDVLGSEHDDVLALFTNHPKQGDLVAFNHALCGCYAAGLGAAADARPRQAVAARDEERPAMHATPGDELARIRELFDDFVERGRTVLATRDGVAHAPSQVDEPVVVTGAALGVPGTARVFDETAIARILRGEQFIAAIPSALQAEILDKHITRLVKRADADPVFETIESPDEVVKLAGRAGAFDIVDEFGVEPDRAAALDIVTKLAIGAGFDALRDAGIPLVQHYKTTSIGTELPDRWMLPDALRDDTGIVFASAFPGLDAFAHDLERFWTDRNHRDQLATLTAVRASMRDDDSAAHVDRRIAELRDALEREPFEFDRKFLFRVLAMGHSQFAEIIGARGPNTHVNAACAATTQAVAVAEDWIRTGRCRRVVIVAADDVTSDQLMSWMGAGFLSTGAAATDARVENAALPFDRRRHGMILGMGAAAIVVEAAAAARDRGVRPICELLASATANSAFHGTRLDVDHIKGVMEDLMRRAEQRGFDRRAIAPQTVFVSHETYTPARGGSASAEINALRHVFGDAADQVVIANTKGFTGHAMGAGIEDVVAIKALETGLVPPVANFRDPDPELGDLTLSQGGEYGVEYALRLAAGFGSQIAMTLMRRVPAPDGARHAPDHLGFDYRVEDRPRWQAWLDRVSKHSGAQLEVWKRRLRVVDPGVTSAPAEPAPDVMVPAIPVDVEPEVTPAPVAAPVVAVDGDEVRATVLALVADKTGYPLDMLDVDLDLEADLGVDTVKQAELFATIREHFGVERDPNLKLRDFPTLAHVITFMTERAGTTTAPAPSEAEPVAETPVAPVDTEEIHATVLALVADKTGYPPDMLDVDLDLEADLGIDTVKQAELFATIREHFGVERDPNLKLRDFPTLAHVIGFVTERTVAVAPTPTPAPAPAPVSAPVVAVDGDEVRATVLALVADKTGYPLDMLDVDLDLEADLGVDTVKQAELFATIREHFGVERDPNLKLRDFPTLAHVIGFVTERAGGTATAPRPPAPSLGSLDAANAIPRRVPVPVPRPPIDACVPTGVELREGSRVVVMPDGGGVADELVARLHERGVVTFVVDGAPPADDVTSALAGFVAGGPVDGVYWLAALDAEGPIDAMDLAAWREALRVRVKLLYTTVRACLADDHAPFLVTGTRLGGLHGYDDDGAVAPLGGATTGFAKAYAREQSTVLVKAVDFAGDAAPATIAAQLVTETVSDPGALEIGRRDEQRWTVGLHEQPAPMLDAGAAALTKDSVFVVTGAAGGIVSAIVGDLAAASGGVFHLLDLTPAPGPDDPDIRRFADDRDALKADVIERMRAAGERPTPVMVEKELARVERLHAAQAAIDAVRGAGGDAYYHSVDLTNAAGVTAVVDEIRQRHGRIDVLVHAAGIDVSRFVRDKEPREFDLVFDVKSDGWFNLLHAIGDMPLGATVAFSSVAGRFGNGGQTDYSAANDLLCKVSSSFRRTRPSTRGIAIDWTAWAGIGMATRGSIPKMMELAGIDMLAPEAGIPTVRRELLAVDTPGEIVIGQGFGVLVAERHPTGGLALDAPGITNGITNAGPMIGRVVSTGVWSPLVVETTLDPNEQPFLHDHAIDGTPVLPGVMGIEAFFEVARLALPGWCVTDVDEVEFLAPLKFYRNEPRTVRIEASVRRDGDHAIADCQVIGTRQLAHQDEPQVTVHFTGSVHLARTDVAVAVAEVPAMRDGATADSDAIYRVYFHGPAFRVLERVWRSPVGPVGRFAENLPPDHRPVEQPTVAAPRLIELCFQTAGIWELGTQGRLALPHHVDRVEVLAAPCNGGPIHAVVHANGEQRFDAEVIDGGGHVIVRLHGYETISLPDAPDAATLRPLQLAMQ